MREEKSGSEKLTKEIKDLKGKRDLLKEEVYLLEEIVDLENKLEAARQRLYAKGYNRFKFWYNNHYTLSYPSIPCSTQFPIAPLTKVPKIPDYEITCVNLEPSIMLEAK